MQQAPRTMPTPNGAADSTGPRRVVASRSAVACSFTAGRLLVASLLCLLCTGCDEVDRQQARRRVSSFDASVEPEPSSALRVDGGVLPRPEALEGVALAGPPVDLGWSQCPGVRLWRFDPAVPTSRDAPRPSPRFFGRDWLRRWLSPLEVLLCELRTHHFVEKGSNEPRSLILLQGPWVFYPDGDCVWREPSSSSPVVRPATDAALAQLLGRRVSLFEHCRHPPRDRALEVFVDREYTTLTVETPSAP